MLAVENLCKRYGALAAVEHLTFQVGRGEIVGFLGPNGAGKTTTLRIVAGVLGATSGRVLVGGVDVFEEPLKARSQLGYLPETCPLHAEMRVAEYLRFRAELKRVPWRRRHAEVERATKLALIDEWNDVLIGHLSRGLRQRVGIADALLGEPPLLILDEPTAGLDPNQIREVRGLVRQLSEKHTVVLSTHILGEVESTCDRAIVIDRGALKGQGTLDELRAQQRPSAVRLVLAGTALSDDLSARLARDVEGVAGARLGDVAQGEEVRTLRVRFVDAEDGPRTVERVVQFLVATGVGVREARLEGAGLEEVFARLTQRHEAEAEEEA